MKVRSAPWVLKGREVWREGGAKPQRFTEIYRRRVLVKRWIYMVIRASAHVNTQFTWADIGFT